MGPGAIVEKMVAAISFGGDLPREDKLVATAWLCCTGLKDDEARGEVRWRGAHLALSESFLMTGRHAQVFVRLTTGRSRSAQRCLRP